jgi:CubicO group peptidase (beta-lactamase class C family)
MPFRTVLLASALALTACQTTSTPTQPAVLAFDGSALRAAERSRAPGLVAAILRDGQVVEMFAWGGADCAGGGTADPSASYEIGSISKHITAVAVLQLWEQGQVDLEAPVGNYLNDIPGAWRAVTLHQLLTHTSGVPDYEEAGGYGVYETQPTPAQVYDIVDDRPLDFEPGTRWHYSNTGYFLLSQVVQRVSGERFGDYLRNHLFEPLGMEHTFMGGYAPAGARLAQGCQPGEGEGAPRLTVRPIHESSTFGAGGISSTLQDWAKWDQALHSGRLLSARSMELLFTPQVLPNGENTGYAFGMGIDEFRGQHRRVHNGQTQGFVADYEHYPDRNVSIIAFASTYHGNPDDVAQALAIRAIPELSYHGLPAAADPDLARTALVRRALRQAVLGEEPFDLLDQDTLRFATEAGFANDRALMAPYVTNMRSFDYLQQQIIPGADGPRHLYRVTTNDGEIAYFRIGWHEGKLHRIRWDNE